MEDHELLRCYAFEGSEAAFAEFVRRRIGLVYAVAVRHTADSHRAEDVVQRVFIAAARDAKNLSARGTIIGWLFRSAQFAAIDTVRVEQRRLARENKAYLMDCIEHSGEDPDWDELRPILDDVLNQLNDRDRDAILLRFFDGHAFAAVGQRLRMTENAARMRVDRALEKMRSSLTRRGVTSTAATLAVVLTNHAAVLPVVPSALAANATAAALASSAVLCATAPTAFLGIMSTSKLAVTLAAIIGMAAIGVALYESAEHRSTKRALAVTAQQRDNLSARLTEAKTQSREVPRQEAPQQAINALRGNSRQGTASVTWSATNHPTSAPKAASASTAARQKLHQRYDPFLAKLGLTSSQMDRFVELKQAIYDAQDDLQAAVAQNGIEGSRTEVAQLRSKLTKPMWDEIREILGPEGYRAYGDYEVMSAVRPSVLRSFENAGVSLPDNLADQVTRLVIKHTYLYREKPTDISSRRQIDWNAVARDAEAILAPSQLEVINPSSSVRRTVLLQCNDLRKFRGDFRHYIRDGARASRQAQAEVSEQLGRCRFGRGDDAQAQFGPHGAAHDRQEHVDAFYSGELLDQLPRAGPQALRSHPLLERAP